VPQRQICHKPIFFLNGAQRCGRCGEIMSPTEETELDPDFWLCGDESGRVAESIDDRKGLREHQQPCDLRSWRSELVHVAGPHLSTGRQPCARCGEDLNRVFGEESLPVGASYVIAVEGGLANGVVEWSAQLVGAEVPSEVPLCGSE